MSGIPILFNKELLDLDIHHFISWVPEKAPHGIIVGATGSGKTYLCKLFSIVLKNFIGMNAKK